LAHLINFRLLPYLRAFERRRNDDLRSRIWHRIAASGIIAPDVELGRCRYRSRCSTDREGLQSRAAYDWQASERFVSGSRHVSILERFRNCVCRAVVLPGHLVD